MGMSKEHITHGNVMGQIRALEVGEAVAFNLFERCAGDC